MFRADRPETIWIVLLAVMVTVIARAVVVPSTAGLTLWLTLGAMAPVVVVQLMLMRPSPSPWPPETLLLAQTITTACWIAIGVAIATVASSIIYGLRRTVEDARDLGQYTLEKKLGGGGMGEVWRARHRMLIRPAAIKIIRPNALGSSPGGPEVLMRRFEREARATAALKSPHTVQLYDFGITEDGTLYYVMELLDGIDLDKLVVRFGPVPAERAIHILTQACHSLADAHQNGLIHRDVKPSNIFVNRLGAVIPRGGCSCPRCACAPELDFVKVLDFGLVKPFVRAELERYLDCGLLCRGFAHLACTGCKERRLVAFSCKGRGFCPSCMGRRMAQTAANLVDHVLPPVPLRQWVLTLPFPLRARLAFDGRLLGAVCRLFVDSVLLWYPGGCSETASPPGKAARSRSSSAVLPTSSSTPRSHCLPRWRVHRRTRRYAALPSPGPPLRPRGGRRPCRHSPPRAPVPRPPGRDRDGRRSPDRRRRRRCGT
jgi:serine/threonine protein kinase